ncbi:hypothetical protein D4764_11G0000440 [Takifugu flavidus]|uniref:Uncharacterized protein n=1 Tax=Takifugu flavidus TaxID=433684 RepID=A0A5C6PEH6_9TELE|nr:hypothetical protein D4764_11G0000440 [Takifugu flavidus]
MGRKWSLLMALEARLNEIETRFRSLELAGVASGSQEKLAAAEPPSVATAGGPRQQPARQGGWVTSEVTKINIESVCNYAKTMSDSGAFSGPLPNLASEEMFSRMSSLRRWLSRWCPENQNPHPPTITYLTL